MNSFRRQERGQDLAEYAITLPIFLVIVFIIFDLGRAAYYYSALQNSAREGARFAVVHTPDEPGIDNLIAAQVRERAFGLDPNDITVPLPLTWTEETVTVVAQFGFQPVTPLIGGVFGGNITMQSSSTMLRENW